MLAPNAAGNVGHDHCAAHGRQQRRRLPPHSMQPGKLPGCGGKHRKDICMPNSAFGLCHAVAGIKARPRGARPPVTMSTPASPKPTNLMGSACGQRLRTQLPHRPERSYGGRILIDGAGHCRWLPADRGISPPSTWSQPLMPPGPGLRCAAQFEPLLPPEDAPSCCLQRWVSHFCHHHGRCRRAFCCHWHRQAPVAAAAAAAAPAVSAAA